MVINRAILICVKLKDNCAKRQGGCLSFGATLPKGTLAIKGVKMGGVGHLMGYLYPKCENR